MTIVWFLLIALLTLAAIVALIEVLYYLANREQKEK